LVTVAFLVPPLFYAGAVLYLSANAKVFNEILPSEFKAVQFLYRLISYVNLGFLLLPLFGLLWARRRAADAPQVTISPLFICFVLTYAGFCVVLKLQHAEVARIPHAAVAKACAEQGRVYNMHCGHRRWMKNATDREEPTNLPVTSYGHIAYATP